MVLAGSWGEDHCLGFILNFTELSLDPGQQVKYICGFLRLHVVMSSSFSKKLEYCLELASSGDTRGRQHLTFQGTFIVRESNDIFPLTSEYRVVRSFGKYMFDQRNIICNTMQVSC